MRSTVILILILIFSVTGLEFASAYHEVREEIEISQMTGIFNSQMDWIMFPLIGEEYHLQVVLRDEKQYENATVNVGYGFNLVERIPNRLSLDSKTPFMGFESTHSTSASRDSKIIQTNKYKFPIIVNFTTTFEKPGEYRYSFFETSLEPSGTSGSSGGEYFVVSKYSKAMENDGMCKNPKLGPLAKHDFSTLVCVTPKTHHELITRGWAPLPG